MAIRITQGANKTIVLSVLDPDGAPQDLSSMKIWFTVRRGYDGPALIEKSNTAAGGSDEQIEVTGVGQAEIHLVPADTAELRPGKHVCDAWVEDAAEFRSQVSSDSFLIDPRVTVIP